MKMEWSSPSKRMNNNKSSSRSKISLEQSLLRASSRSTLVAFQIQKVMMPLMRESLHRTQASIVPMTTMETMWLGSLTRVWADTILA